MYSQMQINLVAGCVSALPVPWLSWYSLVMQHRCHSMSPLSEGTTLWKSIGLHWQSKKGAITIFVCAEGSQDRQIPEAQDLESTGEERTEHRDARGLTRGGPADGPALAAMEVACGSRFETQLQVHWCMSHHASETPPPPSPASPRGPPQFSHLQYRHLLGISVTSST